MIKPEEHTDSYYAASRNDLTTYPALNEETESEICIVGGGFTGVDCALTMAERGHSVTLLEQHRISWGASGRNGGQLIGGIGGRDYLKAKLGDDAVWKLDYRGNDIIKERVRKYDIECDLKSGFIEVAFKPRQMEGLRQDYAAHESRGLGNHLRMVEQDEVQSMLGTNAYIGGMTNDLNGHLHPLNLCAGEARAATSLGAAIYEQSEVINIEHGEKVRVSTPGGSVTADKVLLAGNAYQHLEQQNLSGLVFPAGSFIIATEPLSEDEIKTINPYDLAVCDLNNVLDYYRFSPDNRLLFGGRCNYSGRVPKSIKANMLPRMLKVFPQLEGKNIDYEWGGNIGIVIKRIPLMGRLDDNIFYSIGYSGHGIAPTHVAAEIIANAFEGDMEVLQVYEQVKHFRIPLGQWFGNQIIAMGMLYFRTLDHL